MLFLFFLRFTRILINDKSKSVKFPQLIKCLRNMHVDCVTRKMVKLCLFQANDFANSCSVRYQRNRQFMSDLLFSWWKTQWKEWISVFLCNLFIYFLVILRWSVSRTILVMVFELLNDDDRHYSYTHTTFSMQTKELGILKSWMSVTSNTFDLSSYSRTEISMYA